MSIYDLSYNLGRPFSNRQAEPTIYDRLLSPDEYDQLPESIKLEFSSYMGYVNKFNQQQNIARQYARNDRVSQGGAFASMGGQISSRIGGGKAKGTQIPDYRMSKDIRGRVRYEPIGAHETITGQVIPESIESKQDEMQLETIVPTMEAQTAEQLASAQSKLAESRARLKYPKATLEAERNQQRNAALQQVALRTQIAQQREDRMKDQFLRSQGWKEANALAEREFRKELESGKQKAAKELAMFNSDEREALVKVNNEAALNRTIEILNRKVAAEENQATRDRLWEIQDFFNAARNNLDRVKASKSEREFEIYKGNYSQAMSNIGTRESQTKESVRPPAGAKQAKDGRWYVKVNGKWNLWQP